MMLRLASLMAVLLAAATAEPAADSPLPHPASFDPARYLGRWYEVARLPAPYQPNDTLATAEYSASDQPGQVVVKNQSYRRDGSVVASIEGRADLAPGNPPGRLAVRFGNAPAGAVNYHVMHVDPDYRHAVVGVPSRNALWILSRDVPIPKAKLDELIGLARKAGFDTEKLIVAPWKGPIAPAEAPAKPEKPATPEKPDGGKTPS